MKKLPYSFSREALQKLKKLQNTGCINAEDLMHLHRLIDLRKSQLSEFRTKVSNWTPISSLNKDGTVPYKGTIFEEIDIEIQILDILINKFCNIFEEQCRRK